MTLVDLKDRGVNHMHRLTLRGGAYCMNIWVMKFKKKSLVISVKIIKEIISQRGVERRHSTKIYTANARLRNEC